MTVAASDHEEFCNGSPFAVHGRMTRPRQVLPGQFIMVTRNCTQGQFLLRPDEATRNACAYCLAEAAKRFGLEVITTIFESNHHHTVLYDRYGRHPEFTEHLHKMLGRCLNVHRRRRENFWVAEEVCVTVLLDRETVMDKLVYVATNPVKDFLVERVNHWPGVNGHVNLVNRRPLRALRPHFFFRPDGPMPEEATLEFVIPPELGDPDEVIRELRERVARVEREVFEERKRTGRSILGRRQVLKQSWEGSSSSIKPLRALRPRFAGRKETRIPALQAFREFLVCYRESRLSWLAGKRTTFPIGTYWLARMGPVTVAE
jgi:putative transposase